MDDNDKYDPAKFRREGPSDKAAALPGPHTPYKAAATAYDGELPSLILIMGREGFKAGNVAYHILQYSHVDSGEFVMSDDGQLFRFLFYDLQPKQLTVKGRNLLRIFQQLGSKRLPWIRMTDRDFRVVVGDDTDEPVITSIVLEDWRPEPQKRLAPVRELAATD